MTTYREIEDHEVGFAEDGPPVRLDLGARHGVVRNAIDEVLDVLRIPFHRIHMEIVRDRTLRKSLNVRKGCVSGVTRTVQRRAGHGRLTAFVLHDVDLTARGPTDLR